MAGFRLHKKSQTTDKISSQSDVKEITDSHFYLRYAAKKLMKKFRESAIKDIQNHIKHWK